MQNILERETASTLERLFSAGGLVSISSGLLMVGLINPNQISIFPPCPFFQITGFACPGCGLTRGFHHLFHGDFLTAIDYNIFVPFYAFVFAYVLISLSLTVFRGRGLSWKIFKPELMYLFLILSLIFGFIRNLPFYPFSFLAP